MTEMQPVAFLDAIAHYKRVAAAYAPMIQRGLVDEAEARDAIERNVFTGRGASLTEDQQWALLDQAMLALSQAIDAKELGAIRDIKITIRDMVRARKPPADIRMACFRIADGRLTTRDIDATYHAEVAAIVARLRAQAPKNAGQ